MILFFSKDHRFFKREEKRNIKHRQVIKPHFIKKRTLSSCFPSLKPLCLLYIWSCWQEWYSGRSLGKSLSQNLRSFLSVNRERQWELCPWYQRAKPCTAHSPRIINLDRQIDGYPERFPHEETRTKITTVLSFSSGGPAPAHGHLHATIFHLLFIWDDDRDRPRTVRACQVLTPTSSSLCINCECPNRRLFSMGSTRVRYTMYRSRRPKMER